MKKAAGFSCGFKTHIFTDYSPEKVRKGAIFSCKVYEFLKTLIPNFKQDYLRIFSSPFNKFVRIVTGKRLFVKALILPSDGIGYAVLPDCLHGVFAFLQSYTFKQKNVCLPIAFRLFSLKRLSVHKQFH